MYYVYLLYSKKFDRFYIGQTSDLDRRFEQHNAGDVKSTKPFRPWERIYFEAYENRSDAMRREHFLKKQKNKLFLKRLASTYFENRL